jgi:hypothetical protein
MQPEHIAPHWPSVGAEKHEDGHLLSCLARGMYVQRIAYISEKGNYILGFQSCHATQEHGMYLFLMYLKAIMQVLLLLLLSCMDGPSIAIVECAQGRPHIKTRAID